MSRLIRNSKLKRACNSHFGNCRMKPLGPIPLGTYTPSRRATRRIILSTFAMLSLVPRLSRAQEPTRLVPAVGLAVGVTQLPKPLIETCGDNSTTLLTAEVKGAAQRGRWWLELRAATSGIVAAACKSLPASHETGVVTDQVYPYDRGHGASSLSGHLRYGPSAGIWAIGIGAGQFISAGAPFLAGTIGLRTRGKLSAIAEAQTIHTRLRYSAVTAEWLDSRLQRTIASQNGHAWHSTWGMRIGAELHFR